MQLEFTPIEARVLGVLIEKAVTTPDYYPLSLSGLATGCNQKSNRDPVMNLDESSVMHALDGLMRRRVVWEKTPSGSRVTKYAHRLSNTLGLTYDFSKNELGVLCALMLRGPLTAGEVRARSGRLCEFSSIDEVETVLNGLCAREDGPYVRKLARQPGRKECRYLHLLCDDSDFLPDPEFDTTPTQDIGSEGKCEASRPQQIDSESRVDALERAVEALKLELAEVRQLIGQ